MPYALALGFFDGVHIGHAALIRRTLEFDGLTPAVCTLDRSPAAALGRGDSRLLNSPADRRYILKRWFGVEKVFELPFDKSLQTLAPQDFITMLVRDFDARAFVAGQSYHFGAGAAGDAATLRSRSAELGVPCSIVSEVCVDGEAVSSTRIRGLIEEGETLAAQRLLGHPHILGGRVGHGRSLGHTLGFPTANLPIPEGVLPPRYGVYAVRVRLGDDELCGVANVGEKPTVGSATAGVEVNIFNFQRNIYGEEIMVEFHKFLRPEVKFDNISELKSQVERDKLSAAAALGVTPPAKG